MKSTFRIAVLSAISLSLIGCGSSGETKTPKLYAAPLLNNCIDQISENLFNNHTQEFSNPKIQLQQPEKSELTHIAKSVKSYVAQETEALQEYQEKLDKKPIFHVLKVSMNRGKQPISCSYVFATDKSFNIIQKPIIFNVQAGNKSEYLNSQNHIDPTSPVEYLFELPKKNQGVRLYNLEYIASPKQPNAATNSEALSRISSITNSNNLLEFYELSNPVSPEKAILLANEAVASVEFPHFVRPNAIHVVVPPNKRITKDYTPTNQDYIKKLDRFNDKRFVDADTGIDTSIGILNEMKRELGMAIDDSAVTDGSHEPDMQIKTTGYTAKELAESRRMENQ